jgi:cell division inhibitor SulA
VTVIDKDRPAMLHHPAVWKGQALHQDHGAASISSGFRELDGQLPGNGWPCGALIELMAPCMGIGELRFLAPTLRRLTQSGKNVILLAPPHTPYVPAFEAMGIDHTKLLMVNANKPIDRLWAVEQSIKSRQFGALLTWLDSAKPEMVRRLQLAASGAQGLVFVFRPLAAQREPSAAPLRMLLLPRRYPSLAVQIIKRRGPLASAPIDIAIPTPGEGLRLINAEDPIAVPAPTPHTEHRHAVDRMRHSGTLSGTLSPAAASNSPPARN